jgi:hypothetical protein
MQADTLARQILTDGSQTESTNLWYEYLSHDEVPLSEARKKNNI